MKKPKYKCERCDAEFDDRDLKREADYELGCYVPMLLCPKCESPDFVEVPIDKE